MGRRSAYRIKVKSQSIVKKSSPVQNYEIDLGQSSVTWTPASPTVFKLVGWFLPVGNLKSILHGPLCEQHALSIAFTKAEASNQVNIITSWNRSKTCIQITTKNWVRPLETHLSSNTCNNVYNPSTSRISSQDVGKYTANNSNVNMPKLHFKTQILGE